LTALSCTGNSFTFDESYTTQHAGKATNAAAITKLIKFCGGIVQSADVSSEVQSNGCMRIVDKSDLQQQQHYVLVSDHGKQISQVEGDLTCAQLTLEEFVRLACGEAQQNSASGHPVTVTIQNLQVNRRRRRRHRPSDEQPVSAPKRMRGRSFTPSPRAASHHKKQVKKRASRPVHIVV
jgi:hypothetical protein